jgi:hypothetical protein
MTIDEFVAKYPELYHMAERNSWPSIQEHGLLSVTAILDLFKYDGARRNAIESQWRPRKITIAHPQIGKVVLRDQKPMPPDALEPCLVGGITSTQWYRLLNGKTFFWVGTNRLHRMLTAKAYLNEPQWVITVQTEPLLERYINNVTLTGFNTGFAFDGRLRGPDTFKKLDGWPSRYDVAELAVEYGIPDVVGFVISVVEWKGVLEKGEKVCKIINHIWPQ